MLENKNIKNFPLYSASFEYVPGLKSLSLKNTYFVKDQSVRDSILDSLINQVPYFIFWKDKNSVYTGCNQRFATLVERSSEDDVIGKTDFDLNWGAGQAYIYQADDKATMDGKVIINKEEHLVMPDGKRIVMLVSKVSLHDSKGDCVGVLGISTDITERKKMEEDLRISKETEEQLRRAVMILSGSIAHDLRTPIATMDMYIQALKQELGESSSERAAQAITGVRAALSQMRQSINLTLKSLTQAVTGIESKEDLMLCHIHTCVEKALSNYPFTNKEKEIIHFKNKNSFSFLGNPIYFYRIVFNLIKNALYQIEQKEQGEIFIESDILDDHNILRFKDSAGGVTAKMLENVFIGFNTTKQEGTGVGLAFCQFAMRSIGGDMICHIVDEDCIEFVLSFPKV